jgi:hypothetical protein
MLGIISFFHPKIVLLNIDNAIDPELVSSLIDG